MSTAEIDSAVRSLAYLKTPDRIRAGVRNTYGVFVPLERVNRVLASLPKRAPGGAVGDPTERDGWQYDLRHNRYEPVFEAEPVKPCPVPKVEVRAPLPKTLPAPSINPFEGLFQFKVLAASIGRDFGVSAADIIGKARFRKLMLPRLVLTKLCIERGMSCSQIGRKMGGRDHSTILHQRDMFEVYAPIYPAITASYERHVALREEAAKAREVAA